MCFQIYRRVILNSDIESTSVVKKGNLGNVLYDGQKVSNTLMGVKGANLRSLLNN
jgi:hypothetical protein